MQSPDPATLILCPLGLRLFPDLAFQLLCICSAFLGRGKAWPDDVSSESKDGQIRHTFAIVCVCTNNHLCTRDRATQINFRDKCYRNFPYRRSVWLPERHACHGASRIRSAPASLWSARLEMWFPSAVFTARPRVTFFFSVHN